MRQIHSPASWSVVVLGSLHLVLPVSAPRAAEVTDVADAADVVKIGSYERKDLFDLHVHTEFEMRFANGKITREPINRPGFEDPECSPASWNYCRAVDELRWKRNTNVLRVNAQIGLYQDLALTAGWRYVMQDSRRFRFARGVDGANSSVAPTEWDINQDGRVDEHDQLFNPKYRSIHKGAGALDLGFRWAALNDERDASKPAWVLFFTWSSPYTSKAFDPSVPAIKGSPGPVGDGVHYLSFGTALSKRLANYGLLPHDPQRSRRGYLDPYVELSYTLPVPQRGQARPDHVKSRTNPFGKPPSQTGRMKVGFEVVPVEDLRRGRKVALDFRLTGSYVSDGRNYSELSDPLGEFTFTEQYFTVGGLFGIYAQAAAFVHFRAGVSLTYNSEHLLTNEDPGRDKNDDGQVLDPALDPNEVKDELSPYVCGTGDPASDICLRKSGNNGNYPSYDQVGYRFKDEEHVVFTWFAGVVLTF